MFTTPPATIVLAALAVIFVGLTLRDYLISEGKLTPARKTYLRVAFIFSGIAIALFVWRTFLA